MHASRSKKLPLRLGAAVLAAASATAADAAVSTVGSLTCEPEAHSITTSQELTIDGGYADCTAAMDATDAVVSGAGGLADPVFRITANNGAIVRLRRLTISGGRRRIHWRRRAPAPPAPAMRKRGVVKRFHDE
ncbi:hypothetical protein [Tahibacter caeni]|uniref:hypothetical protein n=1 Tax=Tahibacter caeni TaxID=1453545 RepID=UPI0021497DB0|nr:hypothetical protein [Tahibacter caeni]